MPVQYESFVAPTRTNRSWMNLAALQVVPAGTSAVEGILAVEGSPAAVDSPAVVDSPAATAAEGIPVARTPAGDSLRKYNTDQDYRQM